MRRIPVLSRKQIGEIAEQHLYAFRPEYLQFPQPVDVDKFAVEYLHLRQDYQYLSSNGIYLGMYVFDDTDRLAVYDEKKNEARYISEKADTIIIDKSLLERGQEGRYRFTMGHEIGHGILHRMTDDPYDGYVRLYYEDDAPALRCNFSYREFEHKPEEKWTQLDWQEWQADAFSSALLMPRTAVMSVAAGYDRHGSQMSREELVYEVARTFDVTVTAARVRLECLKVIEPAEKKPIKAEEDAPEIVRQMRERRRQREADDAIYNLRDEDLWNNVEQGSMRKRKHR